MKYSIYYFPLFIIMSTLVFAATEDSLLKQSATQTVETFEKVNLPMVNPTNCNPGTSITQQKKCSDVTNHFCKELWSDENDGNLKVFDGQVMSGKSSKSDLSLAVLENDKALIHSVKNLPEDLRVSLAPMLKKLEAHLKDENSSSKWSRDYSKIKTEINDALEDITDARFDNKKLPVLAKDYAKWNLEQQLIYKTELNKVRDELTIAKYAKHDNWKRVEKIYPEIKNNLINAISKLNIPNDEKERMKNKIKSVELSLPLRDPRLTNADDSCAATENNAFYSPTTNHFTVCAGLFNQFQSESSLAFVIGHELSHAVDSEARATDAFRSMPLAKELKQLVNSPKQTFDCNTWKKMSNDILSNSNQFVVQSDPLENLYKCLRGNKELDEMNLESVSKASQTQARNSISYFATANYFSKLLEKTIKNDKEIIENETYYRPDLMMASIYRYIGTDAQERDVSPIEIFMQNFYCNLEENKMTKESFEKADKESRARVFKNSVAQTFALNQAQRINYYKHCGINCAGLTWINLSMNPQEQVADWMSNKAFSDFLVNVPLEHRAQASALTTTLFCPQGIESTDLATVEKEFSLEEHPDSTNRRMAVYTPEVASLIGCQIDESIKGDSQCNP